ncbi:MAG: sirohydrochlorin chelatase [Acidimicrobiales bacterium]|nr:sirohydrochlorin chelatase [Acidimicrobiales bacterium]
MTISNDPLSDTGLFVIGHGTKSSSGMDQYWQTVELIAKKRPRIATVGGLIEFASPNLDEGLDNLCQLGVREVISVPLVLLGAGHQKDDGPEALRKARLRHPQITFRYGRALGIHPNVLSAVESRIKSASPKSGTNNIGVVLVGRGSTDPDANADLYKVARLISDSRQLGDTVEPAFISLARPSVEQALTKIKKLGLTSVIVAPYFLFTGVLLDRIYSEAMAWSKRENIPVSLAKEIGPESEIVELVWERFEEARSDSAHMNCDMCIYRSQIPGYEHRVAAPPFSPS